MAARTIRCSWREDDDHRIKGFVHADRPRDRKQQRAEQHDRRNAIEDAIQDREPDDRCRYEAPRNRQAGQSSLPAAQAMPVIKIKRPRNRNTKRGGSIEVSRGCTDGWRTLNTDVI
jgi:hypothetical protein